ncbi:MAG: VWA domain-containing protein [Myxococcota bacterium]|nr:VWA domain-containing protein [Myxococcota bacterium]
MGRRPVGDRRAVGLDGRPVHERYDVLCGLLERRLGPRHARLFARPIAVEGGREIEWWCECPGPIVDLEAAPPERRDAIATEQGTPDRELDTLRREHDVLARDVRGLAEELAASGDPGEREVAWLLQAALSSEGTARLAVGDQPVLVDWGLESTVPPGTAGMLEKSGVPLAARAPASTRRFPGLPLPWLAMLLLAGLAPLLTSRCTLAPAPTLEAREEPRASEIAALLDERLAERDALRSELGQLRIDLEDSLAACPAEATLEPVAAAPFGPDCEIIAAPGETPQVVFVLDASRSMLYPDDLPPGIEAEIARRVSQGDWSALTDRERLFRSARNDRMGRAREAVGRLVGGLPAAVEVGLVQFGGRRARDCGVRNHGFFAAGERDALLGRVEAIAPDGGTALGSAIAEGGRLLARSGTGRAVLVVLTDGGETCGKDPCATSRALKRAIPELEIVVIDISDNPSLACIAAVTGGQVLRPDAPMELGELVETATLDALRDPGCRGATRG